MKWGRLWGEEGAPPEAAGCWRRGSWLCPRRVRQLIALTHGLWGQLSPYPPYSSPSLSGLYSKSFCLYETRRNNGEEQRGPAQAYLTV